MSPTPAGDGPARPRRGADFARDVAIIAAMIVAVTGAHLWAAAHGRPLLLHATFQQLYLVPILYAAWVFGIRGGVSAAVASAVPLAAHAYFQYGGIAQANGDTLVAVAMFLAGGGLFGWLRDVEVRRSEDAKEIGKQRDDAYKRLEERAIEMLNVRDYTQSILRSITAAVLTVGPDGSVTTANPAAERVIGTAEFDMVPRPLSVLFEDDGGLARDVAKVLSGRLPRLMRETKLVMRDGRTVHVKTSASRLTGGGGRILGAVVALEDMSEIRSLTEQLIRADRLAALGELTAGVAHEIRNPLGVVRASVQLLEGARCDPERVEQVTSVIKEEVDRADRVIDALLRFGRPPAPTAVTLDVEDVLRDVVLFTHKFADRAGVRIVEDYAGDLSPVLADPDQLKQVFLNLVSNAVQVMDAGGGNITIGTSEAEGSVRVRVADDGPGIPSEELGRVFDPFFTRREGGTGLGLAIVHRIVEEHDGHIEATSTPGEGAVFTVVLPASDDGSRTKEAAS